MLSAFLAFAPSAEAEAGTAFESFSVVDIQRVIRESAPGKAARGKVEAEQKKAKEKVEKLQADVAKIREDFKRQAAALSEAARAERVTEARKKAATLEEAMRESQMTLEKFRRSELDRLVRIIDTAVREVAKEDKVQIVLDREPTTVVFVDDEFDVTDRVIAKLNSDEKKRKS